MDEPNGIDPAHCLNQSFKTLGTKLNWFEKVFHFYMIANPCAASQEYASLRLLDGSDLRSIAVCARITKASTPADQSGF